MNFEIEAILTAAAAKLSKAGIVNSRFDVKVMLAAVLGCKVGEVMLCRSNLTPAQNDAFQTMVAARLKRKPVDKILGNKGFYKYDFAVNSDVLSPRPDTETLVEAVVEYAHIHEVKNILDLGTGSGCIVLSVLAEFPEMNGVGVEISSKALMVAQKNARELGLGRRIRYVHSSWSEDSLLEDINETFDIVVSNPPYICTADIAGLDPEVSNYDPVTALDGGADGLRDYRCLARLMPHLLKDNGMVFLEAGAGQSQEITRIFCNYGFKLVRIIKDLGGIERCVILKK